MKNFILQINFTLTFFNLPKPVFLNVKAVGRSEGMAHL